MSQSKSRRFGSLDRTANISSMLSQHLQATIDKLVKGEPKQQDAGGTDVHCIRFRERNLGGGVPEKMSPWNSMLIKFSISSEGADAFRSRCTP